MYHVSLKIFLSSPGHSSDKWVHVCSNDYKEGFTKIVNFQTSGVDVFVLGGPPSHSVEMLYFFIKIFISTDVHRSDNLSTGI